MWFATIADSQDLDNDGSIPTSPLRPIMKKPFYKILYVQVLIASACGVLLGIFYPANAVDMKPLGDGLIKLIKMIIAPVIFCTVVPGIAGMQDMKKIGRVG